MGGYLRVDLTLLENVAVALGRLRGEFANPAAIVQENEAGVGASELNDALHDFATNWKYHREGLLKSIDAVHEMAQKSHDGYRDTDDRLGRDLTTRCAR